MSKPQDPPRLADASSDTTDAVRAVLRSGQRELPGRSDLARLAARLPLGPLPPPSGSPPAAAPPTAAPPAAAPPAAAPPAAAPPAAAPPSLAPPLAPGHLAAAAATPSVISSALLGALVGLAVVGGVWWRDAVPAPREAAPHVVAHVPGGVSAAAPSPTPSPPADPGLDDADHAGPEAARAAAGEPSRATAPHDALPPGDSAATPRPKEAPIPSLRAPDSEAAALPPPAGAAEQAEAEVHLLQRAQDALAVDPGSALALTDEHARRFPAGALGQEREFIAIRALLALGRAAEARARAASLLERFPGSAYRGRLESLGLTNLSQKNEPVSPRTR
ncbi:hypothetical protein WME76_00865 [Sorangium sp. So ce119]|uniref:hypothetical protein n=1 Tax=Sorangium sp. So ce119 TaxID=3133279 RepID=UPI003F645091